MLSKEIPANKYNKEINRMSKLVEKMFIIFEDFEVVSVSMLIVSLRSMNSG